MLESVPVKELINAIKCELEANYQDVVVEGEISNLSLSSSGHWYFTLSDSEASLSSAMFKMDAFRNPEIKKFKDGDKVLCFGSISVYTKRGTFQLITKRIMVQGKGNLQEQFELLKKKLMLEGLFDLNRKKVIPYYPKKVAIITAQSGAAFQDFLEVLYRRTKSIEVVLIPSLVQGDDAPKALMHALDKALKVGGYDVIIFARGGGSMEDLWAFNHEALVRKIAACPVPVISAVGHQVDFTLCDFVADLRVETPTAAAEVLSEHYAKVFIRLKHMHDRLLSNIERAHSRLERRFLSVSPNQILKIIWERVHGYQKRLARLDFIHRHHEILGLHEKQFLLDDYVNRLQNQMEKRLRIHNEKLEKNHSVLIAMDPKKVLGRGYAFVTNKNKKVINSKEVAIANKDQSLELNFHDGSVSVKIHQP